MNLVCSVLFVSVMWSSKFGLGLIVCLLVLQLAQEFSHFGSVDVKILDSQHALVAVAQHRRWEDWHLNEGRINLIMLNMRTDVHFEVGVHLTDVSLKLWSTTRKSSFVNKNSKSCGLNCYLKTCSWACAFLFSLKNFEVLKSHSSLFPFFEFSGTELFSSTSKSSSQH